MSSTCNPKVNYTIRKVQLSDLGEIRDIWTSFGWTLYKDINQIMIQVDPDGIIVAEDQKSGKVLGVISGINLSADLAFIGQYVVRPEYQRLGIGRALWKKAMEHIGSDRNIALSAVSRMSDKYKRNGFPIDVQRKAMFFEGRAQTEQLIRQLEGISIIPISDDNVDKVIQYDRQICGIDRKLYVDNKRRNDRTVTAVAVNGAQEVVGYAIVGVSNLSTAHIEPLYADDRQIAELLLSSVYQSMASTPITSDPRLVYTIWNTNTDSVELAKKIGLKFISEETLLFSKKVEEHIVNNDKKIFCLCSITFYPG